MARTKKAARKQTNDPVDKPQHKNKAEGESSETTAKPKKLKLDRREFLTKKVEDLQKKLDSAKAELEKLDQEESKSKEEKEEISTNANPSS
jgi:hypothetical protein